MNEDLNKTDESSAAKSDAEPAQTAQAEATSPTETTASNGNDSTPAQEPAAAETKPAASEPAAAEATPAPAEAAPISDAPASAPESSTPAADQTATGQTAEASPDPAPAATDASAEAPAAAATEGDAASTEPAAAEGEAAAPKSREPEYNIDEIYPELIEAKKSHTTIEVEGVRRVRGGVLVQFKKMPMFLPTSHLSLKSNPSENELLTYLHKGFQVHVHEINEEDKSRVIVTRRRILRKERLAELEIGAKVEGKVSSLTDFGAFVNIGGVDGMVHVSRISRRRVAHPSDVLKKGDSVTVVIKDVDVDKERISLSMRELERDAWQGVEEAFPKGTVVKGTVRSLTDFGAYLELKPGIEGLIHISELSWARRLQHPSELISVSQELEALVLDASERNKKISLSYKQTQPNPWERISEEYPIGSERDAKVKELLERGVVVSLSDEVDAFLPKGKMDPAHRSQKSPFTVGDALKVLIMDVVPDNHSLIVGMEGFDQRGDGESEGGGGYGGGGGGGRGRGRGGRDGGGGGGGGRRGGGRRGGGGPSVNIPAGNKASSGGKVTLSELLTEEQKKKLFGDEAEAAKSAPKADPKPAAPAAEAKPEAPAAEAKPEAPAAEAKPEAPAAEAKPEAPAAEAKPEAPAAEAKPEAGEATPDGDKA